MMIFDGITHEDHNVGMMEKAATASVFKQTTIRS